METNHRRNCTGAQQAAPCTPHFFVLSQSLSAALHRPHAAIDVVRLCAHLNQTLNHANSPILHGMLPARKSEVNRNPGGAANLQLQGESLVICHCEERNDEAISALVRRRLLRFARNDNLSPQVTEELPRRSVSFAPLSKLPCIEFIERSLSSSCRLSSPGGQQCRR